MTKPEAIMLAFLRMRHGYSFGLLCQSARAIWGEEWVAANCNGRKGGDQIRGQGILIVMEDTLGLETCESDKMTLAQCHCQNCRETDFYITPPEDVPKQCGHCGSQETFLSS